MIKETCPNCNAYNTRVEGGTTTCDNCRYEWEISDPRPDWPKECQESWAETFTRWAEDGEPKEISPQLIAAVARTLRCNLEYIEALERHIAESP